MAVITDCPNASNAAQWFYKPYMQPSSIITTATSSLMTPSAATLASGLGSDIISTADHLSASALIPAAPETPFTSNPHFTSISMLGILNTTAASALAGAVVSNHPKQGDEGSNHPSAGLPVYSRPPCSHAPKPGSRTQAHLPRMQGGDDTYHYNPYRAPPPNNSRSFSPPRIPGFEFTGCSQAGDIGLMMGKRLSDGVLVTGKLNLSQFLLNHEHRILKRLTIMDGRFDPGGISPAQFAPLGDTDLGVTEDGRKDINGPCCDNVPSNQQAEYENGLVENERYFNRVVEDFLILEDNTSVLILERMGPNLLSPLHHRYVGLEEPNGAPMTEADFNQTARSPFPDVYTFLIFCLKAACVLEGLQRANLAHLALCPTSIHWQPPPNMELPFPKPPADETTEEETCRSKRAASPAKSGWDINMSKLRLFDFTHSKILSHERARAPNNIVEWQTPGFLEYHLQYLAPEQTGRAETWMDHRTDIYSLGTSLFSMLTMQFPYSGNDSVQILQGVLSRDLPSIRQYRPDMPPILDDILAKMTQKQPSQRYQNAFGFKQDILRCLNALHSTGKIEKFELCRHDISFQFVLPNAIFGRCTEQQLISATIVQAANVYQQSLNSEVEETISELQIPAPYALDRYVFEDEIVSLRNETHAKISLSSKTLLRGPKSFDGKLSDRRSMETNDPVVRVIFVGGPAGVGKTVLTRSIAATARNSGLFAGGAFVDNNSAPYSAILSCLQSVLQQLLTQHTDALASLVVAIRTAFEPASGIGIICDLVPELDYFFHGSSIPASKDVPLTHSVARFHALILKLIRVISTHFFMTWFIDDLQHADNNSLELLAALVNVNKRLPIILIVTHTNTTDCSKKIKQILGGGTIAEAYHPSAGFCAPVGDEHLDPLFRGYRSANDGISSDADAKPATLPTETLSDTTKSTAILETGLPLVVRGGGGVRFIQLHNPNQETIQDFLGVLLHRKPSETESLAAILVRKSWLTIRQLVLELYRNETIYFHYGLRQWQWQSCSDTLADVVRKLTGEEYSFLEERFRSLDHRTQRTLVCASICGHVFSVQDLQQLVSRTSKVEVLSTNASGQVMDDNNAMAGLQSALKEGILVYTSVPDHLRFHHGVMRKVALDLIQNSEETEKLHFEMAKVLLNSSRQDFRTASHVLLSLDLIKKSAASDVDMDLRSLRLILSQAGEKSQKSGAQDMALAYWKAALSLLPKNCWDQRFERGTANPLGNKQESQACESQGSVGLHNLYHEALKLHLQCIEAERWRENFEQAMDICDIVLANVRDPIDRARAYQHQIEVSVWAFSSPDRATEITIQCLNELGIPEGTLFCPSDEDLRVIFDQTHCLLMEHMPGLQMDPPNTCKDPRIIMAMEVLSISSASLYYCNVPFMACMIAQSVKLICKYGVTKDSGRALVSFALTYSTWYGCLENAYELGKLACAVSNGNHHVKFLFYLTVQQWGDHIAHSIPALEETLTAVDLTCDRLFHTAGMIHVSVMRILIGRVNLNECMATTVDLLAKHVEFGPKSHGVEVMQGVLQMIKCLKGRTLASNPDSIFDDVDCSERPSLSELDTTTKAKIGSDAKGANCSVKECVPTVHNNSTYQMLKILAAFIFGHYAFIEEATDIWHDDPKSIMNFEGSWITHTIFTVVSLTLVNLLRTEKDLSRRMHRTERLLRIRNLMELRAKKFPTNHAAMFYLLEAEIADQQEQAKPGGKDVKSIFLLYEKAIAFATEGDFPLHKCFAYEFAGKSHLRHGLITSARCLLAKSRQGYQVWGAKGKTQWFHDMYPTMFPSKAEQVAPTGISRRLIYRPSASSSYNSSCPLANDTLTGFNSGITFGSSSTNDPVINAGPSVSTSASLSSTTRTGSDSVYTVHRDFNPGSTTSPWLAGSPRAAHPSPSVAFVEKWRGVSPRIANALSTTVPEAASVSHNNSNDLTLDSEHSPTSTANRSGGVGGNGEDSENCPLNNSSRLSSSLLSASTWLSSPSTSSQSPELDVVDLDVLDFSSVIEAMQVIASEIDLDLLLVKALGVMNQSVGAQGGCVIIVKDHGQMVLAASLNELGLCESVQPAKEISRCQALFHSVINYVHNTSSVCLLANAKDDPRFCSDNYLLKQRPDLKTVLCAPILHKSALVGLLYMENFPERAFANKRMLVMNLLVQQLGISITNALLYQSVLQSETKLNGLLENMPCGIAIWDAIAENCLYINTSWMDMTGFTLAEILESGWRCLIHPDELVTHGLAWKERVLLAQSCQWQCRYALKDGTYRWGVVRMLPIMSTTEQNKILQWLTVTIDIDDQRRAVQLKSNFLANMSHELRTPFSGILGMLSLLKDSSGLSHEQFEFVDMAKASCEMLIRIVDDLLNFSKLEADKVTLEDIPLCFEEILGDVCDLLVPLASRKGLELIILVDDTLPLLLIGDPDRMKQILMNLIGNAIKFSTTGNVVIRYWHEKPEPSSAGRDLHSQDKIQQKGQKGVDLSFSSVADDSGSTIYPYSSALGSKAPISTRNKRGFTTQEVLDSMSDKVKNVMVNHPMMVQKLKMEAAAALSSNFASPSSTGSIREGSTPGHKSGSVGGVQSNASTTYQETEHSRLGEDVVLHCSVEDQGIGMTQEEQKMLFVSFQQTDNGTTRKYGGTGLGLSICSQLINHMRGKITVKSEKAKGSTFTFTACLRTAAEEDRELNPTEAARILECQTVIETRWQALRRRKRILILSPNKMLTEQLTRIVPGAEYAVYESVRLAVDAGLISLKAEQAMRSEEASGNEGPRSDRDEKNDLEPFDFILVDNVLDTFELDQLFPTPRVAFVLLLQPTTETLRWILPPAEKTSSKNKHQRTGDGRSPGQRQGTSKDDMNEDPELPKDERKDDLRDGLEQEGDQDEESTDDDRDSGQVDVGGRGRLRMDSSGLTSSPYVIPPGLMATTAVQTTAGSRETARPSLLFKRRCTSRNSASITTSKGTMLASTEGRTTKLPYHVCRMIKPVRRLKLLQIMYNVLVQQEEENEQRSKLSSATTSSNTNLKRLGPEVDSTQSESSFGNGQDIVRTLETERGGKVARQRRGDVPSSILGRKGPSLGMQSSVDTDRNFPKRARNNDSLMLLLTAKEREQCRGVNVLVAEDDFVSQKILEKQLLKLGMRVTIANNGQEAVERWMEAKEGFYTIAIFDHHMPIMDGLAATKRIRELEQHRESSLETSASQGQSTSSKAGDQSCRIGRIPIVGLSADIQHSTKEKCIKAGMDEYATKPLLTQGLALLIQRYCCQKQ
ncbi:hypothetical protein EMPS_06437 [Entomortierella parvispora]|uniref:Protein kinase domain-containing protein n=1 Tax=Entomortierella parvispora TaxID=205924 RepID=A0A9P3LXF6_9FUNG|nr:hypothetical protein EMPS_06437 [Entomortierella parvispora]